MAGFFRKMASLFSSGKEEAEVGWVEGGLYSIALESGFGMMKVLKTDVNGIHVRMYSNVYWTRPVYVDDSSLFMASSENAGYGPAGIGHMPISYASAIDWAEGVEFVQLSTVSEEELEGYSLWEDARGGYF